MDERFEPRDLLDREALRALTTRSDRESALHLALHVAAFLGCAAALVVLSDRPLLALPLTLALAGITAGFFGPFHECIHQTAFRTRRANRAAAWVAALPFCLSPSIYRVFHWAHHRHTQDPERDPEIAAEPDRYSPWPRTLRRWLWLWSGWLLLMLRWTLTFRLAFSRAKGPAIGSFSTADERPRLVWEARVVAAPWIGVAAAALVGAPGFAWIFTGLMLSHVVHGIWLPAEHTGLPHEGTIFARTRTMHPSRFVQWWLWNMNFHAEHHAWPSIPWHHLPEAHARVAEHVEAQGGRYLALHADAFRARGRPAAGVPGG